MPRTYKKRTFDSAPELAVAEWDWAKNSDAPADVLLYGKEPRWFLCSKCGHSWATRPAHRATGRGCPACMHVVGAATKRTPKPGASLAARFPSIAGEWALDSNGGVTPAEVNAGAKRSARWRCARGHEFELTVSYRTRTGRQCDACRREDLGHKMVSQIPTLIVDWAHDLNDRDPAETLSTGTARVQWRCHVCAHVWPATCINRVRGTGCPNCCLRQTSRWEQGLVERVREQFPASKTGRKLERRYRPDLVIEEYHLVIEFDGYFWHKKKAEQDERKNVVLEAAGWTVLRVRAGLPALRAHDVVIDDTDPSVEETAPALLARLLELTESAAAA